MKVSVSGLKMEKFQRIGLTKGKNPVAVGDANEPFDMQMAMNNLQRNSASQTKKNQLPASGRVRERCGSGTTCDGLIKAMRGNIGRPSSNSHRIQTGPVMDGSEHMALSTFIQTNSTLFLSHFSIQSIPFDSATI